MGRKFKYHISGIQKYLFSNEFGTTAKSIVYLNDSNGVSMWIFSGESRRNIDHGCQCAVYWRSYFVFYMVRHVNNMCSTVNDDMGHITSVQSRFICYRRVAIL